MVGPGVGLVARLRDGSHVAKPCQAAEACAPRIGKGEEGLGSKVFVMAQGEGEDARVPLHVQLGSPEELHLGFFKLALQLLQAEGGLGPAQKVLGAGARKAHGRAAEVAAHLLQRRRHHEALLHWWATGSEEQASRPPRCRLASSPGPRDPAALAFDVAMEVVRAGEALVAELALVGPDARVDAHVVLQVVVVHEFGVAVDAQVRPLPRVLPHVDFELVLPAKEKVLGQAAWAGRTRSGLPLGSGEGKAMRELGLFSLEKRRLQVDLGAACQYLQGAQKKDGDRLSSRACCDRTRGDSFKLKEGRFSLDIRKKLLSKEVVDAPSLEISQARLDGALSNLIWVKMSLLMAGVLD